jgi:hypothetical protein
MMKQGWRKVRVEGSVLERLEEGEGEEECTGEVRER